MENLGLVLAVVVISLLEVLLLHVAPVVFAIALLVYAARVAHRWLRHRAGPRCGNLLLVRTSVAPCEDTAMNEFVSGTAVARCEGITMNEVVISTAAAVPEGEAAGPARRQHIKEVVPCALLTLVLFLSLFLYHACLSTPSGDKCFLPNPVV